MKYLFFLLGLILGGLLVKQMYNETHLAFELLSIAAIFLFVGVRWVLLDLDGKNQ